MVPSVNTIICVAFHSGSHLSQGSTTPMATVMRAISCHRRQRECFICPCHFSVHVLQHGACARQVCMLHPWT